jgi:hypothetical protein
MTKLASNNSTGSSDFPVEAIYGAAAGGGCCLLLCVFLLCCVASRRRKKKIERELRMITIATSSYAPTESYAPPLSVPLAPLPYRRLDSQPTQLSWNSQPTQDTFVSARDEASWVAPMYADSLTAESRPMPPIPLPAYQPLPTTDMVASSSLPPPPPFSPVFAPEYIEPPRQSLYAQPTMNGGLPPPPPMHWS